MTNVAEINVVEVMMYITIKKLESHTNITPCSCNNYTVLIRSLLSIYFDSFGRSNSPPFSSLASS